MPGWQVPRRLKRRFSNYFFVPFHWLWQRRNERVTLHYSRHQKFQNFFMKLLEPEIYINIISQLYITMFAALITSLTVAAPLQVHIAQGNVRLEQPGSLQAAVVVTLLLSLSESVVFLFFSLFFFSLVSPPSLLPVPLAFTCAFPAFTFTVAVNHPIWPLLLLVAA